MCKKSKQEIEHGDECDQVDATDRGAEEINDVLTNEEKRSIIYKRVIKTGRVRQRQIEAHACFLKINKTFKYSNVFSCSLLIQMRPNCWPRNWNGRRKRFRSM